MAPVVIYVWTKKELAVNIPGIPVDVLIVASER